MKNVNLENIEKIYKNYELKLVNANEPFRCWITDKQPTEIIRLNNRMANEFPVAELNRLLEVIQDEVDDWLSVDERHIAKLKLRPSIWFKSCVLGRKIRVHISAEVGVENVCCVSVIDERNYLDEQGVLDRIYRKSNRPMRLIDLRIMIIEINRLRELGLETGQLLRSDIGFVDYISSFFDMNDANDSCMNIYEEFYGPNNAQRFQYLNKEQHFLNVSRGFAGMLEGKPPQSHIGHIVDQFGNQRHIAFSGIPLVDSHDRLEGVIICYDDWTDQLSATSEGRYVERDNYFQSDTVYSLDLDCQDMASELMKLGVYLPEDVDGFVLKEKQSALEVCKKLHEFNSKEEPSELFTTIFGDKFRYSDEGEISHLLRTAENIKFVLGGHIPEPQSVEYVSDSGERLAGLVTYKPLAREGAIVTRAMMTIVEQSIRIEKDKLAINIAETYENLFESAPSGLLECDLTALANHCQSKFGEDIDSARAALIKLDIPDEVFKKCKTVRRNQKYFEIRPKINVPGSIWQDNKIENASVIRRVCLTFAELLSSRVTKGVDVAFSNEKGDKTVAISVGSVLKRIGNWPVSILISIQDVTQRAEAELMNIQSVARYASLFESAPFVQIEIDMRKFAGVMQDKFGNDSSQFSEPVLFDDEMIKSFLDSEFLLKNRKARDFFGTRTFKEYLKLGDKPSPESIENIDLAFRKLAQSGVHLKHHARIVNQKGEERVVNTQYVPLEWIGLWPSVVLLTITDVTDEVKAYESLEDLTHSLENQVAFRTAELTELNRNLTKFAYSVSHDLRSPLRSLSSRLNHLLSQSESELSAITPEQLKKELNTSIEQVGDLAKMIMSLLQLSTVENSSSSLKKVPVDLGLDKQVARLKAEADFEIIKDPLQFISQKIDPSLMELVWQNLLENSIQYQSPDRKLKIEVNSWTAECCQWYEFSDNGIGIDNDTAEKMFLAFEGSREKAGFGIGLATVKRIIERHSGYVYAYGEPGVGTTIRFWIPEL